MSTENMLVISTAHLDEDTNIRLENGIHFGIDDIFMREYGYLIFPHAIQGALDDGNAIPKCLVDILDIAKLDNATLIMLDCDGDEDGRIQSFDW